VPKLKLYFQALSIEPCYIDSEFLRRRVAAVRSVCRDLQDTNIDYLRSRHALDNTYFEVRAWDEGLATFDGCSCEYPGHRTTLDEDMQTIDSDSFAGNLTWCLDPDAQTALLEPTVDSDVRWYEVWLRGGIAAQLVLEVSLVNLAYALIGYCDPLANCGGCYELPRFSAPLQKHMQDDIAKLLRVRYASECFVWGTVALLALVNLGYAGMKDIASEAPELLVQNVTEDPECTAFTTRRINAEHDYTVVLVVSMVVFDVAFCILVVFLRIRIARRIERKQAIGKRKLRIVLGEEFTEIELKPTEWSVEAVYAKVAEPPSGGGFGIPVRQQLLKFRAPEWVEAEVLHPSRNYLKEYGITGSFEEQDLNNQDIARLRDIADRVLATVESSPLDKRNLAEIESGPDESPFQQLQNDRASLETTNITGDELRAIIVRWTKGRDTIVVSGEASHVKQWVWDRFYEFDTNRDGQLDEQELAEFIQDWMQKKAEHTRREWMENRNVTKDIQQLLDSFGTEGRLKDIAQIRDLVEALEKAELRVQAAESTADGDNDVNEPLHYDKTDATRRLILSNEQREKRVEREEQQKQQKKREPRVETTNNPLYVAAAAATVAAAAAVESQETAMNPMDSSGGGGGGAKTLWKPVVDPSSGKTYYVNRETKETVWKKPADADTPWIKGGTAGGSGGGAGGDALPDGWVEHLDQKKQKPYYHNTATGETAWRRPTPCVACDECIAPPTLPCQRRMPTPTSFAFVVFGQQ
jgi:hypothetical protein